MSNLKKHFEYELNLIKKNLHPEEGGLIIEDFIDNIRDIIETFSKQGHSGGSAPCYASTISDTIKKTLNFEPLSPIMGTDDEWTNDIDPQTFQNKRCSAIFKNNMLYPTKNRNSNKPYYIDAIIWQGKEDWDTFTGKIEDVASWQYIKKFPFTPKRFYIDVIYEKYDINKHGTNVGCTTKDDEDYVTIIKDRNQLKEVEKYYDMLEQLKELNPGKYYKITRKEKIIEINANKDSK